MSGQPVKVNEKFEDLAERINKEVNILLQNTKKHFVKPRNGRKAAT